MIKFNKHNVTDTETKEKARIFYSVDNRVDGRKCVTLYAKDYTRSLGRVLPKDYKNASDSTTDYFESGTVVLFEEHPLYQAARKRAETPLPETKLQKKLKG